MQNWAESHSGATASVAHHKFKGGRKKKKKEDGCFEKRGVKGGRVQYNKACNSRTNHWTRIPKFTCDN